MVSSKGHSGSIVRMTHLSDDDNEDCLCFVFFCFRYFEHVGEKRCTIVDTWWQTETGGHLATPLPGITPMKPGSCTLPFYGVELCIMNPQTGKEIIGNEVEGVLCVKKPWPGIARTVYGDHERYLTVYMKPYKGK